MSVLVSSSYVPEMMLSHPKEIVNNDIPLMLKRCVGVCFVKVYRIGLIVTVRAGKGVLLHKVPIEDNDNNDNTLSPQEQKRKWKWSAPCPISYAGPSIGASIGIERSKYIIFLMTEKDVSAFVSGTLSVGLNGTGALGPVGRSGEAFISAHGSDSGTFVYAESSGIYGGISLEFTGVSIDNVAIQVQYGKNITSGDIIHGRIPKPAGEIFDRMYQHLDDAINFEDDKKEQAMATSPPPPPPPLRSNEFSSNATMTNDDAPSADIVHEPMSKMEAKV